MNTYGLAIPGCAFLLVSLLFPAFAPGKSDDPQTQSAAPPTSATAARPSNDLSAEEQGRLYLARKEYVLAEGVFRRLTQEQPKSSLYWNELGISLHNQTRLDDALKCYQKSARLNPQYPDALNNQGTIWYAKKKYTKAIRVYKKAIAIRDSYAPFYLNLGYAYFGEKDYQESIASFRKALQLDPDAFETSKSRLGTIIQDRSLSTDRGRFYFLLAKSFAESGNVERCVVYLKKARDEGFQELNSVKSDPSFKTVLKDPAVQEVLAPKPPETAQP